MNPEYEEDELEKALQWVCKLNSTVPYISAQTCPYLFPLAE